MGDVSSMQNRNRKLKRSIANQVIGLGFMLLTVYPPSVAACPDGLKHSACDVLGRPTFRVTET